MSAAGFEPASQFFVIINFLDFDYLIMNINFIKSIDIRNINDSINIFTPSTSLNVERDKELWSNNLIKANQIICNNINKVSF